MKKLLLTALIAGCCAQVQAVDVLGLTNIENKSEHVMFIAWRYDSWVGSSKSDYERLLPGTSTDSSLHGRSTLQVELGPKINSNEEYKKEVNARLTEITQPKVNITLDKDGKPVIAQSGSFNSKLLSKKTVYITNDTDHVLFIAWALEVGPAKSKSNYVRIAPKDTKDFDFTTRIRDELQVEVGQKSNAHYKKLVKESNQDITSKRVNITVNAQGRPVITQE